MSIDPEFLYNPRAFVGKMIEVRENEADDWTKRIFACVFEGEVYCKRVNGPNLRPWLHAQPIIPKRIVPTDADAERRPRCWYRDISGNGWECGVLVAVGSSDQTYPFFVRTEDGDIHYYSQCEIEAPNG